MTYVVCECVGIIVLIIVDLENGEQQKACHQRDAMFDFCFVYCCILKPRCRCWCNVGENSLVGWFWTKGSGLFMEFVEEEDETMRGRYF